MTSMTGWLSVRRQVSRSVSPDRTEEGWSALTHGAPADLAWAVRGPRRICHEDLAWAGAVDT